MRVFIAVDLPDEAKDYLSDLQEYIRNDGSMKVVDKDKLHLTLRFLGEMNDSEIDKLKDVLKQVKFEKIKARLGNFGVFTEDYVRVVWISLEPKEKFREMHEKIDELLEKEKIAKADKFESHITLARVKSIKNKESFLRKIRELKVKPLEFEVKNFSLKKSIPTRQGHIHEDIITFPGI